MAFRDTDSHGLEILERKTILEFLFLFLDANLLLSYLNKLAQINIQSPSMILNNLQFVLMSNTCCCYTNTDTRAQCKRFTKIDKISAREFI